LRYRLLEIGLYSVKNSDTTDRYGQIITVGGVGVVGGDFSHTPEFGQRIICGTFRIKISAKQTCQKFGNG